MSDKLINHQSDAEVTLKSQSYNKAVVLRGLHHYPKW